jgi:hypothetical protein
MDFFRHFPGYLMAAALMAVGVAHTLCAWFGWMDRFGTFPALAALSLSLFGGFNAFGVVGAFFFANDYLRWTPLQSAGLAMVGLLFISRGVIATLLRMLTAPDAD